MAVKENFIIDIAVFLLFLIGFEPALTGKTVHEWINLAFAGVMLAHLVMHWDWAAAMVRRQIRSMSRSLRLSFFLNLLLFVVFVAVILSGLMNSRSVLGWLRLAPEHHSAWHEIHSAIADSLLFLAGLHIALHWKWVKNAWKRFGFAPDRIQFQKPLSSAGWQRCD